MTSGIATTTLLGDTYRFSKADSLAGSVKLLLISSNNGLCSPTKDSLTLSLLSPVLVPVVNASGPLEVCSNNSRITLGGTYANSQNGITWSTLGTGKFGPTGTSTIDTLDVMSGPNVYYTPSPADTAAPSGRIGLVAKTNIQTTNGGCRDVSDTIYVGITRSPNVDLKVINPLVCTNNLILNLSATITGANGGRWKVGSGTYSPARESIAPFLTVIGVNKKVATVSYRLNAADLTVPNPKSFSFITTVTSGDLCNAVTVPGRFNTRTAPNVTIVGGPSRAVCKNNPNLSLPTVILPLFDETNNQWFTNGSGTFSPNSTVASPVYIPSSADTAAGSVRLIIAVYRNPDNCNTVYDTLNVQYTDLPTVYAGPNISLCENNLIANL